LVFGVVLMIAVYSSCDEPERTVMTKGERELLDSLYATICKANYQIIFDRAADSIKQIYIQEIQEIIEGEG